MKKLLTMLLICLSLSAAKAQLIEGYNLGQINHFAQLEWRDNGYIPKSAVEKLKSQTPLNYRTYCRMTGTMANQWALDLPGYNHPQHEAQITSRRIAQPGISYADPFFKFFHDFGFDSLIWTVNTISAYTAGESPSGNGIWMNRLWAFLDAIDSAGIPISHICLDNESWMYGNVVGISAGNPTAADKVRYNGTFGVFLPNNRFETPVKAEMHKWLKWLEELTPMLRKRYPHAKILMTVDHPATHLRGRWMWDVVRSYAFYDGVTPHLYPNVKNVKELTAWIDQRLKPLGNTTVYITEWNYHYDSGQPWGTFHFDFLNIVSRYPNVKMAMRHCLWAGDSNGFSSVRLK
jgi:hypothetical protein